MGIDFLDLVFRLERHFSVTITSDEGLQFATPGDIKDFIWRRVNGHQCSVPSISKLHDMLQKRTKGYSWWSWFFFDTFELEYRIPRAGRAQIWQEISADLGYSLPALEYLGNRNVPRFPKECKTTISLAQWIVKNHPDKVEWKKMEEETVNADGSRGWTEDEVWLGVVDCISEAICVKPEKVTPGARLIEDLGME